MNADFFGWLRGVVSLGLYSSNTILCCTILGAAAIVKLMVPVRCFRKVMSSLLNGIAMTWVGLNNWHLRLTHRIRWEVSGVESLSQNGWYLVLANHQSWVDILVLQKVFHRKIPMLKFFLKKELIWVPFLGFAWWALDFPFMKRYSKAFLDKHPHLRGKDLEITRKACEKFKSIPISVVNFVEGTRFTPKKHSIQQSPYAHLLRPKAGGIAYVLAAMGEQIQEVLNVTIVYPKGSCSFWDFLCGRITDVRVRVQALPINVALGDYFKDAEYREQFQEWLNGLWTENDRSYEKLLGQN